MIDNQHITIVNDSSSSQREQNNPMVMSFARYTPYLATLAIESSVLPIHLVAFGMVTLRWESY
jgi:hypothetical protein